MTHEEAIREWIARKIRGRGHHWVTRDHIINVRYAIDEGFIGTDETPGDEPEAALVCDLRRPGYPAHSHAESIEHVPPAVLVSECLAIWAEGEERRHAAV